MNADTFANWNALVRYNSADAGRIVVNSVWLNEVAILEDIAVDRGAPKHHPYRGAAVDSSR